MPCIGGNLLQGGRQSPLHDPNAGALIAAQACSQAIQFAGQLHEHAAAAGHDAFLHGGAGGVEGILDAQLAVLELGFGGSAHLDHGHAAGQLGHALDQLLAVVVGLGVIEFALDGRDPIRHGGLVLTGGHDRGFVLADRDAAHAAQVRQGDRVEVHGPVFAHQGGAGEDGDVLQGGLAAVAEAGGANGRHLQHAAVLVHHQGGKGLALHFLREDHQGLAGAGHRLQDRYQVVDRADLAVGHQQQGVLVLAHLAVAIGDEVGGAVAAVEGHALGDLQLGGQAAALLHGDHAVDAHLGHGLADHPAHLLIATGAHRGHLTDGVAGHGAGAGLDALNNLGSRFLHTAAQVHGAGAGGHVAQAFTGHGLGQHRGGGGAVTGLVLGLGGDLQQQLGADVFERILQLNLAGDGDAVIHHVRGAELLLQHHIAALGTDGDLHRVRQGVHAPFQGGAGGIREGKQFGHRRSLLGQCAQDPIAAGPGAGGESRIKSVAGPARRRPGR